jgi:alkylation response protein AidB-like acyl-CoA dehydrogenase
MDFDLSDQQQATLASIESIVRRHATPDGDHDDRDLAAALKRAGFLDLFSDPDAGPLDAELVVEQVSSLLGGLAIGARSLVGPALLGDDVPDRIGLARAGTPAIIRYGADLDVVIVQDGETARAISKPRMLGSIESRYGFPLALIELEGGRSLGAGSGDKLRRWWRVANAAEIVGLATEALSFTARYLSERRQFGRALASFQALQHRLAEAYVYVEGARWATRFAAWTEAEEQASSIAGGYAQQTARLVSMDMHQLTGAIGFTSEFALHRWTTRLQAVRLEADGQDQQFTSVATARWPVANMGG